ncbi:hypothetical protein BC332_16017 [Capsicum chinense]|nr:hypothetical protein BC332_16017 [Capsicum chinense]
MNNSDREWMYDRLLEDGSINPRFIDGVESFVEFAKSHPKCMDGEKLRCSCNHRKCRNKNILDKFTVMAHLENNGFVPNYYRWHHHGESYIPGPSVCDNNQEEASALGETGYSQSHNEFRAMVFDSVGPSFDAFQEDDSQMHKINIDENKIPSTLNDLDGMLIDMEEGDEEEKEKDEDEDEDDDDDKDENEDEDENMSDTPSLVAGSVDTPGSMDISIGSSSSLSTTRRFVSNGHSITKTITKNFKERLDAIGYTWRGVTESTRKFYWHEFMATEIGCEIHGRYLRSCTKKRMAVLLIPSRRALMDYGLFVAVYAEFLSDGHQIPSSEFDPQMHCIRYTSLLWDYGVNKTSNGYVSDNQDPPRP